MQLIKTTRLLSEAIEAVTLHNLTCMISSIVRIASICQFRNISMEQCVRFIVHLYRRRIFPYYHLEDIAVYCRIVIIVIQSACGNVNSFALIPQHLIKSIFPRSRNKAIAFLCKITGKTHTNSYNTVRHKIDSDSTSISLNLIIIITLCNTSNFSNYSHYYTALRTFLSLKSTSNTLVLFPSQILLHLQLSQPS